jgi:hypothetical protein
MFKAVTAAFTRKNSNVLSRGHTTKQPSPSTSEAIRVVLTGATTATLGAISVTTRTPILALCRILLANNFDPATPLQAFRSSTLCLTASSIGAGAGLTVNEAHGCNFSKWQPFPAAKVRP